MATYKTTDMEIISAITRGEVTPQVVKIPKIDTTVKGLLTANIYQGPSANYTGEIMDYSYTSSQDIAQELNYAKQAVKEVESKLPKKNLKNE